MENWQKNLWQQMLSRIDDYIEGRTDDFYSVVGDLEGSLDASEIKDRDLLELWYDNWTPLEICRAENGNHTTREEVLVDLLKMKAFIEKSISN